MRSLRSLSRNDRDHGGWCAAYRDNQFHYSFLHAASRSTAKPSLAVITRLSNLRCPTLEEAIAIATRQTWLSTDGSFVPQAFTPEKGRDRLRAVTGTLSGLFRYSALGHLVVTIPVQLKENNTICNPPRLKA